MKLFKLFSKKKVILTRTACLGREIVLKLFPGFYVSNLQKFRVDYLLELFESSPKSNQFNNALQFLKRKDIAYLILEQNDFQWEKFKSNNEKIIVFDSFADLTDQKFTHRLDNWSFYSHFSDLNHNSEFEKCFHVNGLLSLEDLDQKYLSLFNLINEKYKPSIIFFINYPTNFEKRHEYIIRAECIFNSINRVSSTVKNLINISLEPQKVSEKPSDNFPYHFHESTVSEFVEIIKQHINEFNRS